MNMLLAVTLLPLGMLVSFARPWLSFAGFALLFSGGFAYLNPGWVDPAFAWRILGMSASCYAARFACDFVNAFIENRI